ncbi:MAG: LptF/LptG family permease [Opitutales bacterium]
MFKRFDRYLLIEWLKALVLCATVIVTILLFERFYDDLGDLLEFNASIAEIARYFAWRVVGYIPTILPAILLLSSLLTLIQLQSRRELVSLRSAGLGTFRITRVFWLGSVIASASIVGLNGWFIPWSVESANLLYENLKHRQSANSDSEARDAAIIQQLTFYNLAKDRLWYFDTFNLRSFTGHRVHLYTFHEDQSMASHLSAAEAHFDDVSQTWTFQSGTILHNAAQADDSASTRGNTADLYVEKFETWSEPSFQEQPRLMLSLGERPKDLSISALRNLLKSDDLQGSPALAPFYAQYHQLLASPAMCLVITAIAIPFATRGVRVNPMVGASQAIFIFFVYYMLINTFTVLGGREVISAPSAAWAPHGIMAVFAMANNLFRTR